MKNQSLGVLKGLPSRQQDQVYTFADLTLDPGRRRICRGRRELDLPKLSFDLLETLVLAAPNSLSNDQLMEQVWNGRVVSQATIAKRVELLRQALGDDSSDPRYVALVRGHGYRLIPKVQQAGQLSKPRLGAAAVAAVLIALAGLMLWTREPVEVRDPSIAVLPFVALSSSPDDQLFADGLTEELSHVLSSSGRLRVSGRTSSFVFRDQQDRPGTIGERLGVAHLLTGTVRRSGERLRVTAQLVSTEDGFDLWSESYDRQMADIIAIQQDIAGNVAERLFVSLGTDRPLYRPQSISPHAYALYLKALSLSPYGKSRYLDEAQRLVEQVTELAPDFAPAWNRLAAIHGRRLFGRDPDYALSPQEAMPIIRDATQRALALDPESSEAYALLGGIAWGLEGDAAKAAPLVQQALELDPWNLETVAFAAEFAKYIGRVDEALALEELLVLRDPLCLLCRIRLAKTYVYSRRFEDAEREWLTLQSMEPGFHWNYGVTFLLTGRPEQALASFDRVELDYLRLQGRAMAQFDLGRIDESSATLDQLELEWGESHPLDTAQALAYTGQLDKAFGWLERSLPRYGPDLQTSFPDPLYDRLREDPRWRGILEQIQRAPEQMAAIPFSLEAARGLLAD
ncbi:MAG: winged helix-turn-helix domain-containing protein [Xanthomonadales bacterium]|nr:winged helix-turn-helix domain-containing protein [Xanthomonadales bacterium]